MLTLLTLEKVIGSTSNAEREMTVRRGLLYRCGIETRVMKFMFVL